jgi:ATP-dependent exoDNAse (exonuclease V) alpha subunit
MITLKIKIKNIIFTKEDFSMVSADIIEKIDCDKELPSRMTFYMKGVRGLNKKTILMVEGNMDLNKNYGYYINCTKVSVVETTNQNEIMKYLTDIDGIGKTTVKKIVDTFKDDTLKVIEGKDDRLYQLLLGYKENPTDKQTKKAKLNLYKLYNHIMATKEFQKLYELTNIFGIPNKTNAIWDEFGLDSVKIFKTQPWKLYKHLDIKTLDILRKFYTNLTEDDLFMTCLTITLYNETIKKGQFYIESKVIEEVLRNKLSTKDLLSVKIANEKRNTGEHYDLSKDKLGQAILTLEKEGLIKYEFTEIEWNLSENYELKEGYKIDYNSVNIDEIYDNLIKKCQKSSREDIIIYFTNIYNLQSNLVEKLNTLINTDVKVKLDYTDKIKDSNKINLDKLQIDAVNMMFNNNISLLTGGAGTGKTQTVNAFLNTLKKVNPDATFKLLAPTGKASNRMTELTGEPAQTIHKCLGIKNSEDTNEKTELITDDYVIVDESGMVDAFLFCKLLWSISEDTKLILIGDVNQLSTIGIGNIFKDLLSIKSISKTILTKVFRQALQNPIIKNANIILNKSKVNNLNRFIINPNNNEKIDIMKNIEYDDKFTLIQTKNIELSYDNYILTELDKALVKYEIKDIQILVSTNKEADRLNKKIQSKLLDGEGAFRIGDKVIHTKNNYNLGVMNGQIGFVSGIEGREIYVNYNDVIVIYNNKEDKDELKLAYAITAHKSQGSEFKVVIATFNNSDSLIHSVNMLYTVVTRAKDICVLISTADYINKLTQIKAPHKYSQLTKIIK